MATQLLGAAPRGRLLLIVNPAAGRHGRPLLCETLSLLTARGRDVDLRVSAARGDAEAIARAADPARYAAVVAVGGDGTINEVINGLAGGPLPLGIIPLGTTNVLAREIGLGFAPSARAVADAIDVGAVREVRLGRVNDRLFAVMAGIGFDARVVASVSLPLKRRVGRLAYVVALVRELLGRYRPLRLLIDGAAAAASMVIVARGRYYAGPFIAAPAASLSEPLFQAVLIDRRTQLGLVEAAAMIAAGQHALARGVRIVPAREVEVLAPEREPVQADGDLVAEVPARFTIADRPLRLLVP